MVSMILGVRSPLSAMKDSEIIRGNVNQQKKAGNIFYLIDERDNILEEKQRLRSHLARLVEEEEPYKAQFTRPNLLQNPNNKGMIPPKDTGPSINSF